MQKPTRRSFISATGVVAVTGLAGCLGGGGEPAELVVMTHDGEGDPLPGTQVTIDGETVESNDNAQATFEDLETEQTYEYVAEHDGYSSAEGEVTIPEGQTRWFHEVNLEEA